MSEDNSDLGKDAPVSSKIAFIFLRNTALESGR